MNDLSLITITDQLANFTSMLAIFVLRMNDCTYLGIPSFLQSCTNFLSELSVASFSCSMYFSMNLKVLLGDSPVWLSKVVLQSLRPCSSRGLKFVGWCFLWWVTLAASIACRTLSSAVGTVKAQPWAAASNTVALSVLLRMQMISH